ncbi:MAG: branched-chain amino acid transaminase [Alphaproteobacteria bacterium]|nr:branched-chain amino acid transaminase [Alphaproteobacteria bacterium]
MSEKKYKVWLNGKVVRPEEASVSVFTQTAMRGANVYEGIRCYWDADARQLNVWKLDQHIDRLFQSMKIMRMETQFTKDSLKQGALDWARANEFREDVHFRLVVYLGDGGSGGVRAFKADEIDFGAVIFGGPRRHQHALDHGLHVAVSSWRRISDDVMPARVKAGANYQNNRLAAMEARTNGYDDALILNRDGSLAEATGAAVMMVREGQLITPPVTAGILESITRKFVIGLYEKYHNMRVEQRNVDRTELYIADEIFCCGTAEEVTPIVSVDRIAVGSGKPGPITRRLQELLEAAARGKDPAYRKELTPVY